MCRATLRHFYFIDHDVRKKKRDNKFKEIINLTKQYYIVILKSQTFYIRNVPLQFSSKTIAFHFALIKLLSQDFRRDVN